MNKHAATVAVRFERGFEKSILSNAFLPRNPLKGNMQLRSNVYNATLHFRMSVRDYCARDCNYANAALPRARPHPLLGRSPDLSNIIPPFFSFPGFDSRIMY